MIRLPKSKLTKLQRKIVLHVASNQMVSVRELCDATRTSSTSVINHHIDVLVARGILNRHFRLARSLTLAEGIFVDSKGRVFKCWQPHE